MMKLNKSRLNEDSYNINKINEELSKLNIKLYYLEETATVMQITENSAKNHEEGLIAALADHQTGGKGRDGRKWIDRKGCSILFSLLVKIPDYTIATFADLVALTICKQLRKSLNIPELQIKYPNDLVFKDKKLGGILLNNIYDDKLNYLATNIGIGLNIHYKEHDLSKFTTDYGLSSLDLCSSKFNNRQELFIKLIKSLLYLNTEVSAIINNNKSKLYFDEQWKELSSIIGRKVVILKNKQIIEEGTVTDSGLGIGISINNGENNKWFSLFGSDMQMRVIN